MGMLNFNAGRWKRHAIPLIVWLAALLAVGFIFLKRSVRLEMSGMVADSKTQVAAFDRGIINKVMVTLYQPVNHGDVLAVLDDSILRSELSLVKAELELLKAKLAMKRQSEERRFMVDVEKARLTVLELKAELEPDRIALLDKKFDLKRFQALAAKQAVTEEVLKKTEFECQALEKKIAINETRMEQAQADLLSKQKRAASFSTGKGFDGGIEYIRNALNVESLKLKDLQLRLQNLVIKSPIDGVVTRIKSRVGDVVAPGESIFTVVISKSVEVLAYVSEQQVGRLQTGDALVLKRANHAGTGMQLKVTHLGPAVELLPERLWQHPSYPQYGVPVTVLLPENNALIPGEVVKLIKQ